MRYFLEVAYMGTQYGGFQKQHNANTVQGEMEKALHTYFQQTIILTGSSRTDAGVHARQNFFHADMQVREGEEKKVLYHLNAILPYDIVVKGIFPMSEDAHCRFDAISRYYIYSIHTRKDPFAAQLSHCYPYHLNRELLVQAAGIIPLYKDFESFSKKKSQAKTTICTILQSEWKFENDRLVYHVEANRFLRGMVKGLVGTMLRVAREQISFEVFENLLKNTSRATADFSVPSKGLCLEGVRF